MRFMLPALALLVATQLALAGSPQPVLRFHIDPILEQTALGWRRFSPLPLTHVTPNTLTAIQALIHGDADVIAVRRPMTTAEQRQFRQLHRSPLLSVPIGLAAIGIFASGRSSLRSLSLAQLEALFSASRSCHFPPPQTLPPIKQSFGLSQAAGNHGQFSRMALCGGTLKPTVTLLPSDPEVLQMVAGRATAIGYASAGLAGFEGVRLLPLRRESGAPPILPTPTHLQTGRYPLTHYLYLHLAGNAPATQAFANFVLSDRGQSQLTRYGFAPLPRSLRQRLLSRLENR